MTTSIMSRVLYCQGVIDSAREEGFVFFFKVFRLMELKGYDKEGSQHAIARKRVLLCKQ